MQYYAVFQSGRAVFKYKQDKANEHLLTGAYIDVRDQNKAQFNAVLRRISKRLQ